MIKLTELKSILETSGLKVVYDDFDGQKDETPRLPFISYYVTIVNLIILYKVFNYFPIIKWFH